MSMSDILQIYSFCFGVNVVDVKLSDESTDIEYVLFSVMRDFFLSMSNVYKRDDVSYETFQNIVNVNIQLQERTKSQLSRTIQEICETYTSNSLVPDYKRLLANVYFVYYDFAFLDVIAKYFVYAFYLQKDKKNHYITYLYSMYYMISILKEPKYVITDMRTLFSRTIQAVEMLRVVHINNKYFFLTYYLNETRYKFMMLRQLYLTKTKIPDSEEYLIEVCNEYSSILKTPKIFDDENKLFHFQYDHTLNLCKLKWFMYSFNLFIRRSNCYCVDDSSFEIYNLISDPQIFDILSKINNLIEMKQGIKEFHEDVMSSEITNLYSTSLQYLEEFKTKEYLLGSSIQHDHFGVPEMKRGVYRFDVNYTYEIDKSIRTRKDPCIIETDIFNNKALLNYTNKWLNENSVFWATVKSDWYYILNVYITVNVNESTQYIMEYVNHLTLEIVKESKYSIHTGMLGLLNINIPTVYPIDDDMEVISSDAKSIIGLNVLINNIVLVNDLMDINLDTLSVVVKLYDEQPQKFKDYMPKMIRDNLADVVHLLVCARLLDVDFLFAFVLDFMSSELKDVIYLSCKNNAILKSITEIYNQPNNYHSKYVDALVDYINPTNTEFISTEWKYDTLRQNVHKIFGINDVKYRISDFLERIPYAVNVDMSEIENEQAKVKPDMSDNESTLLAYDLYTKYGPKYIRFFWRQLL